MLEQVDCPIVSFFSSLNPLSDRLEIILRKVRLTGTRSLNFENQDQRTRTFTLIIVMEFLNDTPYVYSTTSTLSHRLRTVYNGGNREKKDKSSDVRSTSVYTTFSFYGVRDFT